MITTSQKIQEYIVFLGIPLKTISHLTKLQEDAISSMLNKDYLFSAEQLSLFSTVFQVPVSELTNGMSLADIDKENHPLVDNISPHDRLAFSQFSHYLACNKEFNKSIDKA